MNPVASSNVQRLTLFAATLVAAMTAAAAPPYKYTTPVPPGKAWFTILRLYGPLEPWFNKTWRPDDIRLVK
jgi:hypothetical protein